MAKKKVEKPKRELTKRQLSHWEQQKRRQRLIFILGIFVIVAVLLVVGVGWYTNSYRPIHQIVIRVNDTYFNTGYYINMLKYYGRGQEPYYVSFIADQVTRAIEQNELVRQEAAKLGITVSNKEIDAELSKYEPPRGKEDRDPVRAELLSKKLLSDYFDKQVPESAEQRQVQAMFLESESQAREVRNKLEGGASFGDLASELSLDEYSKTKKGELDWRPQGVISALVGSSILDSYVFSTSAGVLSQPIQDTIKTRSVGYWIMRVVERKEEPKEAHVEGILLGSQEGAQKVKARLEAGESLATLAVELSQESQAKENKGDLGWVTEGSMSEAVKTFIFDSNLALNTLSEPIRDDTVTTKGGYWLVKVLEIQEKKIEGENPGENRYVLKVKLFQDWLNGLWATNTVEDFLNDQTKAWAVQQATEK